VHKFQAARLQVIMLYHYICYKLCY